MWEPVHVVITDRAHHVFEFCNAQFLSSLIYEGSFNNVEGTELGQEFGKWRLSWPRKKGKEKEGENILGVLKIELKLNWCRNGLAFLRKSDSERGPEREKEGREGPAALFFVWRASVCSFALYICKTEERKKDFYFIGCSASCDKTAQRI